MIWINTEDVICIHNRIIEKTKGIEGIRDLHGLEAAIAAPLQTFGGQDLFPTDIEKIARLGYGLAANHAFLDGNKRIGAEQLAFKFRIGVGELRVLRANHTKQAQCCFKWAESSAICYMNLDSAAALAAEFCAVRRIKGFAEQAAFVGQKGKRMDCIPNAEPRRANHLERFGSAAPIGKVCSFKQAGARINEGAIHSRNRRRRRDKRQCSFIVIQSPRYACTRDDCEGAADVLRFVDKTREFANGQACSCSSCIFAHKG